MFARIFTNNLEESTMFVSVLEKELTDTQSQLSNAATHKTVCLPQLNRTFCTIKC